ncbi:SbcC/MukB-like Walker B domain-containing protein [Sediminibacterium sp.]|uniref:SbcC/MukB-like Walker B domain-containing protein n=1 Tax=Sediminibacterium sp. TaxID=1917865 RepID=UPI0025D25A30|nr:SbcC/MukB-like Walker B domain-containing protein [Sediminibacterium sp.]
MVVNFERNIQQNLFTITQQRGTIFNGVEIAGVEQKLRKAIDDAIVDQKTIKGEKDELNSELTKAEANKIQLNQDKESFNISAQKLTSQIEKWLSDYKSKHSIDINEDDLVRLLTYSNEWVESERTSLNLISEAITKAQATFDERCLQVINHEKRKTSTKSLKELTELDATIKSNSESAVNEKNEIEFKLRNDLENKKKVGSLFKETESKNNDHENWGKLNDLLGSSDGKKFRQIAQEYTLDILLGFANIHLQVLTNRYKLLRVSGSLGLQVIDKDMGNEVRTVYSLSGGESFLVSLALALGLASLSSNKMQVESLFIDEGFGSLDPATLSIAMDALERLHNQGRKVGVISHVQEMTERIPVQIKVTKQSSGKSKIEVSNLN